MFTETAYEAFMKLKQVRRRSWGGGLPYIYIYILGLYRDNGKENGDYYSILGLYIGFLLRFYNYVRVMSDNLLAL